jgi:hypothetical protein
MIPLPPLTVQEEIVAEIEGYQKIIDGARQIVENYKPTIKIDPAWEVKPLYDLCSTITKGTTPYLSVFVKKLKPNQIYKLKVRAVSSFDGRKTYGAWKTYTVVPQPVQNTPKVMLDGSVKVTWKKVKGATKYIVYGSTKPDKGYKKIKSVGKDETSYRVKKIYGKELELNNNYFIKLISCKFTCRDLLRRFVEYSRQQFNPNIFFWCGYNQFNRLLGAGFGLNLS